MYRPYDSTMPMPQGTFEAVDPIIPLGVFAVNTEGNGVKCGNGTNHWSALAYLGSNTIGGYLLDPVVPTNNNIIVYNESNTKFVYRLQGYIDTHDNWDGSDTVFPTFCILIETDEFASLTGRIKMSDGITPSNNIQWVGFNFDDWPTGYGLYYNGTTLDYEQYQPYNVLPFATTPIGKVLLDDGTWGYPTIVNPIENLITSLIEVDDAYVFGTITLGGYPMEATSVTLTTDGTYLYVDDQKVWTEYIDGEGSGLDADTLDGHHYTYFATGPVSATSGNFVEFGESPNELVDSGYNFASFGGTGNVTGPPTSTINNFSAFSTTDGIWIEDSGYSASSFATPGDIDEFVTGSSSSISGNIAIFLGTTGKVIEDSSYSPSDFATIGYVEDESIIYSILFGG